MKEAFLNNYMNIVTANKKDLSQDQIDKFRYGIEGIYLTITKLIVIFIIGAILGILKEILLLLIFYNLLRFFGFGYHARGSKECLAFSLSFFVILPYLVAKKLLVFKYNKYIILLCLINFLIFAPSDTKKRPMINKKKKIIRKTLLMIVSIIYSILIFNTNYELSSLLLLSLVIESIMVNPLIYKLTGQPYNNYKNYILKN